jgi:hypothetical protein
LSGITVEVKQEKLSQLLGADNVLLLEVKNKLNNKLPEGNKSIQRR